MQLEIRRESGVGCRGQGIDCPEAQGTLGCWEYLNGVVVTQVPTFLKTH